MFNDILLAAVMPAIVLVWFIYKKDKYQPEPTSELLKGFGLGAVSAIMAVILEIPLMLFMGGQTAPESLGGCLYKSFCVAALPEELAKLFFLFLLLRRSKYYDEYVDGIVYAVTISMGFAALENVLYLFVNQENWRLVGAMRGILSVPGHFLFAVPMGYYFSLWCMKGTSRSLWLMLLVPVLLHGLFDFLLMYGQISYPYTICFFLVLLLGLVLLWANSHLLIKRHLDEDLKISKQAEEEAKRFE